MKLRIFFFAIMLAGCAKQQIHPPIGGVLSEKDLAVSKDRAKNLNTEERRQIEEWIANGNAKYYPMGLNYWTDIENLNQRTAKSNGEKISYEYTLYDFDNVKIYDEAVKAQDAVFGRFKEPKAIEDALRYLQPGEETTLLVPSVLAFGTYGDGEKIPNDMPIIVKLKVLK